LIGGVPRRSEKIWLKTRTWIERRRQPGWSEIDVTVRNGDRVALHPRLREHVAQSD